MSLAVPRSVHVVPPAELARDRQLSGCGWVALGGVMRPALGGIALLARLGRGGMGVVYFGVNPRIGREMAVKVLPTALGERTTEMRERLLREARLAAQIRSEHVVSVIDVDRDRATGSYYLLMEFVDGISACAWVASLVEAGAGGAPELAALEVTIAATRGLAAAHGEGIVHRDVKPENVLIPRSRQGELALGRAKLSDLGLARIESVEGDLTSTMIALGTPGYMAPEQVHDARTAGKSADVFSMGATLYSLLAGACPFGNITPMEISDALLQGRWRPIREAFPGVSETTATIVERCLAADPTARYPDAAALLEALLASHAAVSRGEGDSSQETAHVLEALQRPEIGRPAMLPLTDSVCDVAPARTKSAPSAEGSYMLLLELRAWDAAVREERVVSVAQALRSLPDFRPRDLQWFACGSQRHEIALLEHVPTGMTFALVPGATFLMGSPGDERGRAPNETQRALRLSPFVIACTTVTQAAWTRVMGANPSRFTEEPERPVDSVNWHEARAFCATAGLALPTEAQWEYACRAGSTSAYSFGDSPDDLGGFAWFRGNSEGRTHRVAAKAPNAFGLHDVHGNIWEWCEDGYGDYAPWPTSDPLCNVGAPRRAFRGGSWYYDAAFARSAARHGAAPATRNVNIGFRPARRLGSG